LKRIQNSETNSPTSFPDCRHYLCFLRKLFLPHRFNIEETGTDKGRRNNNLHHHILARQAMNIFTKSFAAVTLAAIGILGLQAQPAQAQYRPLIRPYTGQITPIQSAQQTFPVNTNWYLGTGLTTQQYLYNQAVQAQVFNQYPAWAYGYNPYPPTIYQQNTITPPVFNYPAYPSYPSFPSYTPTWAYYPR
jgi:hypothetical protein